MLLLRSFSRVQPNFSKQNQHEQNSKQSNLWKIEPYFYEEVELYPIVTQIAYFNHTLTQTHHNPRKLITINLQIFKMLDCFTIKS